jgi:hypothetical protein
MSSFLSKHSRQTTPDQQYRQQIRDTLAKEYPEDFATYMAMNSYEYKYVLLRKEGKTHSQALNLLEEQSSDEA